jgi:hypothetical protein
MRGAKGRQPLKRGLSNNKHNDKDDKIETHAMFVYPVRSNNDLLRGREVLSVPLETDKFF